MPRLDRVLSRGYYEDMTANAVGKQYTEAQRAYLAGFLDADGAIMATIERHHEKAFGARVRVTVKITQRDRAILDWFQRTFLVGLVRQNRTTFDWLVRNQQDARQLVILVLPYLRVKQRQAKQVIAIIDRPIRSKADLLAAARQADALSKLNVRSQGRRRNSAGMIEVNCSPND